MNNEEQDHEQSGLSRRGFLHGMGGAGALLGMTGMAAADDTPKDADGKVIPGFEKNKNDPNAAKGWQSVSDRKVRVGIAGYGLCKFGAAFFYQNHPNVEVVAATDLDPGRCAALAKRVAICGASVDGQARPSGTADCAEQRRRWQRERHDRTGGRAVDPQRRRPHRRVEGVR